MANGSDTLGAQRRPQLALAGPMGQVGVVAGLDTALLRRRLSPERF